MKIKYNILWFEDDVEVVQEDSGIEIVKYLTNLGFEPIIKHEIDGKNLEKLIKNNNYDLIVSDLNLANDETGDKLIEHIRDQSIYTEVLLYSAVTADIINIIERHDRMIERVSFSVGLGDLSRKLKDIIYITIKKVQDVNNMRGLVIAETIDLEGMIEEIVKKYFDIYPGEKNKDYKQELYSEICKDKIEKSKECLDISEKMQDMNMCKLIDEDILTIYDLYKALQRILKKHIKLINERLNSSNRLNIDKDNLKDERAKLIILKEELDKFNNEIILIRNTLAHVQENVNEKGMPCLQSLNRNGTEIIFDEEKYSAIRKDIIKHSINMNKIKDYIETITYIEKEVAATHE